MFLLFLNAVTRTIEDKMYLALVFRIPSLMQELNSSLNVISVSVFIFFLVTIRNNEVNSIK
jgi:hypothetical protein